MRRSQPALGTWDQVWTGSRFARPNLRAARARQKGNFLRRVGLAIEASDIVLDIGCGSGDLTLHLLRHGVAPRRWIAVDRSTEGTLKAIETLRDLAPTVEVLSADAGELPFADKEATVAIAAGVLEHIPDARAAVAEIGRVVRPGGQLAVVTSHKYSFVDLERRIRRTLGIWPYGYQCNHTVVSLSRLLAPWFAIEAVEVGQTAWDFPTAATIDRFVAPRVSRPWGRYLVVRGTRI